MRVGVVVAAQPVEAAVPVVHVAVDVQVAVHAHRAVVRSASGNCPTGAPARFRPPARPAPADASLQAPPTMMPCSPSPSCGSTSTCCPGIGGTAMPQPAPTRGLSHRQPAGDHALRLQRDARRVPRRIDADDGREARPPMRRIQRRRLRLQRVEEALHRSSPGPLRSGRGRQRRRRTPLPLAGEGWVRALADAAAPAACENPSRIDICRSISSIRHTRSNTVPVPTSCKNPRGASASSPGISPRSSNSCRGELRQPPLRQQQRRIRRQVRHHEHVALHVRRRRARVLRRLHGAAAERGCASSSPSR